MLSKLLIGCIQAYRFLLSPILPPACRFHPTCSVYSMDAIRRYGPFRGGLMMLRRLLKCHPWHPGGYDPVV